MKRSILLLIAIITGIVCFSQEEQQLSKKEQRRIKKEQQKADREKADIEKRELVQLMLEARQFVLEADYVGDQTGQREPVSRNINFVAVDSAQATLQLGSYHGVGLNGVGGITVDGRVTKYELKTREGKKGNSYYLLIFITSSLGNYDISLNISSSGNADATVRGTVSGQLRYYGELVPPGLSRVYKGRSFP